MKTVPNVSMLSELTYAVVNVDSGFLVAVFDLGGDARKFADSLNWPDRNQPGTYVVVRAEDLRLREG